MTWVVSYAPLLTPRDRQRAEDLYEAGWRVCVVDREAKALRRVGCPMRRVGGSVWYAPGWAVEFAGALGAALLEAAVDRYLRGLPPEAMESAYALGGASALQEVLTSDAALGLPPRPLRLKGARRSTRRVA